MGGLRRSGRYRPLVPRILDDEGVPEELIYLAQAESGFHAACTLPAGGRSSACGSSCRASWREAYGLHARHPVNRRPAGSGKGDPRGRASPARSLQPRSATGIWRWRPTTAGRARVQRAVEAHRLCGFLGALQAPERAAQGDVGTTCRMILARDHHVQEPQGL